MTTRSARSQATRRRIATAASGLFIARPYAEVTLTDIAEAAGVSHQTVLNHYESKAGVAAGAAELMGEQTTAARHAARPGDVPGAVRALVGEYERMGDANARWASEAIEEVAHLLDRARQGHQEWLATMFGAGLPPTGRARRRAINALHAATDVYVWKLLRRDLGLSRPETEKTIIALVEGILRGDTP